MQQVLKLPAYRRLLVGYAFQDVASSIGSVALALLVYGRTGSAIGAAVFFLCSQFAPALLAPLMVSRLDQRSSRRVLGGLYTLEAFAFLALAWVAGRFSLAPVLTLALIDGAIALTARALSRAVTVSVTTPRGLLREGNAVTNAALSISYFVGPAIGGAVVAVGGTSAALLSACGLFVIIAIALGTASGLPTSPLDSDSPKRRVRSALAYIRNEPFVFRILSLQAVAVLFFTISVPVEVVFAEHSLHAGATGYGFLLSAWGAGAIVGSTAYVRWRSQPAHKLIALGAACVGTGFLVMASAPSLAVALVGAAIAGTGNGIEVVAVRTALQEAVQHRWMAMIMSFDDSLFQMLVGAGIVLGGAVAALAGPRAALATGGVGSLAITAVVWVLLRPGALPSEAIELPVSAEKTAQPDSTHVSAQQT